jgi:hypothetical protein
MYGKTKNSLDENTTFVIWLLKIVSSYTNSQNNQTSWVISTPKPAIKSQETKNNITDAPKKTVKNNTVNDTLSHDDISDVFWWIENNIQDKKPVSDDISVNQTSDFNLQNFISELKKLWAKWGLTMALRWSGVELIWNSLIIRTKTKIASTQVTNVDNIATMCQVLEKMWIENPEIKPN